ncbi:MAG: AAA family ATPase [Actinomycetota bacterium]|nr:AAA family ATPase [Actinomycetota bacterium]
MVIDERTTGHDPVPAGADTRPEAYLPYLPRIVRDWATDPTVRHRRIDASMLFVDLSGFTAMSERLARSGNVGAEEVTDIISGTFAELLRHAYARGGSLVKFGGDALLLMFDGSDHPQRAAAAGYDMKVALHEVGTIPTSAGTIRLGMTGGIHSDEFDLFLAGSDPHELIICGPAISAVVTTEGSAKTGEIMVSSTTAGFLPAEAMAIRADGGIHLRRAPSVPETPAIDTHSPSGDLERFVPSAVRIRVAAGDSDPEHRRVAVGFINFRGVDALIRSDPATAAKEIDRLVADVQQATVRRGATFLSSDIDIDGGKLILVAGAPAATGHDEESMLLALRDIVGTERSLDVRAGTAAGTVFFGDVGPVFRRTLTVMGDTVNLSARLMAAADSGSLVTTPATLNESSVCFAITRLEPLHLKGKKSPVRAMEVGAPSGKADRVDRSVPLIGRDEELSVVREAIEQLADGSGGALEIMGEAGLGKSMFLSTAFDGLSDGTVLTVGCDLYDSSTPYRAAQQLLTAFTGIDPTKPSAERDLSDLVGSAAPHLAPMLPLIATAFRIQMDDTPDVAALQPEFRNEVLFRSVGELLSALAERAVIAVVDDAQWADAASRDLLSSLARLAAERPWLLVFAGSAWTFDDDSTAQTRIELGPLSFDATIELANALTADDPLAPHEIEALARRSGGIPMFLHGLVDAVADGGDIDALPIGVEGLVAARLDELPAGGRRIIRTAAVLGPTFNSSLLASVSDGFEDIAQTLATLPRFVEPIGEGRYRFSDAMVREVAYERIPFKKRRALHDQIADVLIDATPDDPPIDQLAFHCYRAQRWEEAHKYADRAARRAESSYANVEAIHLYTQALNAARHLDLSDDQAAGRWETIGDLQERVGRIDRADAAYREARRFRTEPIDLARLMYKHAEMRQNLGRYPEALRWLTRGLRQLGDLSGTDPGAARAHLEARYGAIRQAQGKSHDAIKWCNRAMQSARASGSVTAEALATKILDGAQTALGRAGDHALAYRSLELYEQAGDLDGQAQVMNNLGSYAFWRGDWDEAVRLWDTSSEMLTRIGDAVRASLGTGNVAEILADQGHLEEAESRFREVRRIWSAAGDRYGEAFADLHLARIATRSGRLDEATALFGTAGQEFAAIGASVEVIETHVRHAEGLLFARRHREARTLLGKSGLLPVPEDLPPPLIPVVHRTVGFAHLQFGEFDKAAASFQTALAAARLQGASYEEALVLAAQIRLALIAGDAYEALADEHQRLVSELDVIAIPAIPGKA